MDNEQKSTSRDVELLEFADESGKGKDGVDVQLALEGTMLEHETSVRRAAKSYWKGIIFSMLISLSIIMRAYDIEIVGSFFALPAFRDAYGEPVAGSGNQIAASWQVTLGVASLVGQVIGSFAVTYPMDKWGRRKTLLVSLILTACFTFMQVFAPSIQVLVASEYISGVFWGGYQVLVPTFASEIMPTSLRSYMTGYINVCYAIGALLNVGIVSAFDKRTDEWGYKIPFAIQWIWPVIIIPAVIVAPESPWFLVRNGKLEEAEKALKKLSTPSANVDLSKTVAMMQKTDMYERKVERDPKSGIA